jgi:glucose-1-phosphate thymidylyltransferase
MVVEQGIINGLIIAGGFGTRSGLENLPKGLVELGDSTTIIDHIIKEMLQLHALGQRALISNAKFYGAYKAWLEEMGYSRQITLVNNGVSEPVNRLGAIGDILFALNQLDWPVNQGLLVLPSDTLFQFALAQFIKFAQNRSGLSTVLYRTEPEIIANRLGCATINQRGEIVAFQEKPAQPQSNLAVAPFYFYHPKTLPELNRFAEHGGNLDAPSNIIPYLLANRVPVSAFVTNAPVKDIGTQADIQALMLAEVVK